MRRVGGVGLILALALVAIASPAVAVTVPMTCPDGTEVQAEVDYSTGEDAFSVAFAAACVGHMGNSSTGSGELDGEGDAGETGEPVGTWVDRGPVCENGGTCAAYLQCEDGTYMHEYVFVFPDGSEGATNTACPGDPDRPPVPALVPPTPGQIFTAFKEKTPTASVLAIQPPNGQTLVNFETVFSTKADPFTTAPSELVPGFTVEFEIFPKAFSWNFGDGTKLTTDTPGKPWESGHDVSSLINHVYTSTDPVKASVTTTWGANVRLNGGAPVAVAGTVDKTSPEVALEILEATPELVR